MKKIVISLCLFNTINSVAVEIENICESQLVTALPNNRPPFSFLSNGVMQGYHVELMKTIFEGIGCDVEVITDSTWSRSIILLTNGEIDFLMNAVKSEERERLFYFSEGYEKERVAIYAASNIGCEDQQLQDFYNFKLNRRLLGVVRGAEYGDHINNIVQDKYWRKYVIEVKDHASLRSISMYNRVDVYLDYFPSGLMISDGGKARLCTHPVDIGDNHFIVSKDNDIGPTLIDKINKEISKIKINGVLESIRNKYFFK